MALNNEFMTKLAGLLEKEPQKQQYNLSDIELIPNKMAELQLDGLPIYQENVVYAKPEDLSVLREKKQAKEPEDMIAAAHPKSVYVSNALGDGGLVENQNEQHEKMVQTVNKRPTGNLVHIYAELVEDLVKLANKLEDANQRELVNDVDNLLQKITSE